MPYFFKKSYHLFVKVGIFLFNQRLKGPQLPVVGGFSCKQGRCVL